MTWMWAVLLWVLISIPTAVLIGRLIHAGQREASADLDAGPIQRADGKRRTATSGASDSPQILPSRVPPRRRLGDGG